MEGKWSEEKEVSQTIQTHADALGDTRNKLETELVLLKRQMAKLQAKSDTAGSGGGGVPITALHRSMSMFEDISKTKGRSKSRARNWMDTFASSDPRKQLANFFMDGDNRGPLGYLLEQGLMRAADPEAQSQHFAVYRPTSLDAIRMMMTGMATGKGLNVKGKSSKTGKLSGYVRRWGVGES